MNVKVNGRLVFVSDDVMFWARVRGVAQAAGVEAIRVADEAGMEAALQAGTIVRVIADLGARGVDAVAWAGRLKALDPAPHLIAFGSHVDAAALARAREAGFDEVMPNSRFHREVASLVR